MNMGISEKVAYLKGLAEGLNVDESTKEGKLLLAIVDVLNDMAEEFEDIEDEIVDLEDGLDAVIDDLNDVEEFLYETSDDEDEEDDEDDDDEYFVTTCPECEEEVIFDESVLEDGEVVCPNCGAKLEFDLSDLANATAKDEDDED
jgi:DNA-directed RNA polymerase subunit RPC12/RpoP